MALKKEERKALLDELVKINIRFETEECSIEVFNQRFELENKLLYLSYDSPLTKSNFRSRMDALQAEVDQIIKGRNDYN